MFGHHLVYEIKSVVLNDTFVSLGRVYFSFHINVYEFSIFMNNINCALPIRASIWFSLVDELPFAWLHMLLFISSASGY